MSVTDAIFVIVAAVAMIGLARLVQQWLYGHSLQEVLTDHDNVAVGLAVAGYFFAVIWTQSVLLSAPGRSLWQDIVDILLYGGVGIVLLTAVAYGSCRVLLARQVREQLVEQHNVAAAIVVAGAYVATSVIYSGGLVGEGGGFGGFVALLVFFVLGQLALLGITYVFRWLTSYDDVEEIAAGNIAAGMALAGLLVAVGIVVSRGVAGEYTGLVSSLRDFGLGLVVVVAFYPVRQIVVQWLMLGGPIQWRGGVLDDEIARDKNIAAGALEATTYVATALFITHMI